MSGFVVGDASLAFKWLLRKEHTDKALAILRVWQNEEVTPAAPHLLPFEVSNALHKRVTRKELSVEGAVNLIGNLLTSRIELHQPYNLHGKALEGASRYLVRSPSTTPTTWRWLSASAASAGDEQSELSASPVGRSHGAEEAPERILPVLRAFLSRV